MFNRQLSPFKNNIKRYQEPIYKILADRPAVNDDGGGNLKFSYTEAKEREADFQKKGLQPISSRFYHVSPCVLDSHHCTLEARKKARLEHQQAYNSILQMGQTYFKTRNMDESFKKRTTLDYPMHRFNIEKAS